jgi:hypothetical protein
MNTITAAAATNYATGSRYTVWTLTLDNEAVLTTDVPFGIAVRLHKAGRGMTDMDFSEALTTAAAGNTVTI